MAGVTLEIGGRSFEIAPFKIAQLRRAAPFIDQINALIQSISAAKEAGETPAVAELSDLARALIEVIAVGVQKVDPAMTADEIEDLVDLSFLGPLQVAVFAILEASGLSPKGEAKAPSARKAKGAR